ncbi:MBL fold metallo-hydrolase [Burkholderia sp. Bp9142]|nr:MBL fold metallo-hydrolase [Burkholderia sp. Bp9142]
MTRYSRATTLAFSMSFTVVLVTGCGGDGSDGPRTAQSLAATPTLTLVANSSAGFVAPDASLTETQRHLALATANAGNSSNVSDAPAGGSAALYDPTSIRPQWCWGAENTSSPPGLSDGTVVAPVKMFDNLWAFGYRNVLQYAFKADNGKAFLIDTLNNSSDAQSITVPGLTAMGLSGSALEGALVTHGHPDHYGGAGYLQTTYGTPTYMGSADASVGQSSVPKFTVTSIDSSNLQPQQKDFGSLSMTLLSTPGHTAGTVSAIVSARISNTTYQLAILGGAGFPSTLSLAQQYQDSVERMYSLAATNKISGTIQAHAFIDGSLAKLDSLTKNPASYSTANPFLIGNALAMRSLAVVRECAAAKVAQLNTSASIAAWHVTQIRTTAAAQSGAVLASAVVSNPFGYLQNASVKFTVSPTGESCTAYTNSSGQASCTLTPTSTSGITVTAAFSQANLADGSVELASSGTVTVK